MSRRADRIIRGIVREIQESIDAEPSYLTVVQALKDYYSRKTGIPQSRIDVEIKEDDGLVKYRAIVKPFPPPGVITMTITTEGFNGTT